MNDKISVIIPAYNIESYLGRTLESVMAQTYENIEIVVVNDGSKDGTGAVIDSYAERDHRIKAIHKENGGVTSARLRGVQESTGEWIGFVDGDDFVEPQMFEALLANAEKHGADISHCGYRMVFPSRVDFYYNTGKKVVQEGIQGLRDVVSGSFVEPGLWNKLYRRALFDGLPEWMDTSIKNMEDLLMNYYLFRSSRISVYEDFCPYHYMLRKGSAATSKLNRNKLLDPQKVLVRLIEENEKTEKDNCLNTILQGKYALSLISLATISTNGQVELIKPVRKQSRRELRKNLSLLFKSNIAKKIKLMALWAAVWPWSYGFVHRIYSVLTGHNKKYSLD